MSGLEVVCFLVSLSPDHVSLMIFGFFDLLLATSRRTSGRSPFHPKQTLREVTYNGPIRFPQNTFFSCRRSRTATRNPGGHSTPSDLRTPYCTSSRLRAEEYDRPVTQSMATPEPSSRTIPTLDRAVALPDSSVCHHTWEPTVLSKVSCRPSHLNVDRFHQPCLLPWRNPLLAWAADR